jgi:hypothetical protein
MGVVPATRRVRAFAASGGRCASRRPVPTSVAACGVTAAPACGYMEMGEEIDHFLTSIKGQTGDDYGVLVDKTRIDRAKLASARGEDR